MSLFNSPELLYLKLNLLFIVAFGLWLVFSWCGKTFSVNTGKKGKLTSARWLLISVLVLPFLLQWLTIQLPVSGLTGFTGDIPGITGLTSSVSDSVAVIAGLEQLSSNTTESLEKMPVVQQEYLLLFWLLVALGMTWRLTKTVREVVSLRRLIREGQVYKQAGSITVLYSDATTIPLATRFLGRAYIVIPSTLLLSGKDVKMVLLHEGEHLRNGDLWWSWLMECLSVLCFWNPAVYGWQVTLHNLQEYACDETLMERKKVSQQDYGRCLLCVAEAVLHKRFSLTASMSMWPSCFYRPVSLLKRRVAMLTERTTRLSNVLQVTTRVLMIGIMGIFSVVVFGATQVQEKKIAVEQAPDQKQEITTIEQSQPEAAGTVIRKDNTNISELPVADNIVSEVKKTTITGNDTAVLPLSIKSEAPDRPGLKKPARHDEPSKLQLTRTSTIVEEVSPKASDNVLLAENKDGARNESMPAGENKEQPVNPTQNPVENTGQVMEKNTQTAAEEKAPMAADAVECRMINTPGIKGERKACGTPENWKEYEHKLAMLGANTTCREFIDNKSRTVKAYCGTPEEWKKFDNDNKKRQRRLANLRRSAAYFPHSYGSGATPSYPSVVTTAQGDVYMNPTR